MTTNNVEFNTFEATAAFLIHKFLMVQKILDDLNFQTIDLNPIIDEVSKFETLDDLKKITQKWSGLEHKISKEVKNLLVTDRLEIVFALSSVDVLMADLLGKTGFLVKIQPHFIAENDWEISEFLEQLQRLGTGFYWENIQKLRKLVSEIPPKVLPTEFLKVLEVLKGDNQFSEVVEGNQILINLLQTMNVQTLTENYEAIEEIFKILVINDVMISLLDFYQTNSDILFE